MMTRTIRTWNGAGITHVVSFTASEHGVAWRPVCGAVPSVPRAGTNYGRWYVPTCLACVAHQIWWAGRFKQR